ncbi:MAG: HAD family hydrolase [Treponema sp.]|jgi:FMN phosphatase YigB (HAD superfamily)|nr:HAD family hydrolase [Treponema sp.]
MKPLLDNIKTILFDLDGTVYQNNDFHRLYLSLLVKDSPYASWEGRLIALADDILADDILSGKGIPMNRFYRAGTGAINSPEDLAKALAAGAADDLTFPEAYKGPIPKTHFFGDAWALLSLMADTLGMDKEAQDRTFREVRARMLDGGIAPNTGLIETLTALKNRYVTILLSNSPQDTADAFIRKLGLQDAFTHIGYGSGKPYGLSDCLGRFAPDALENPRTLLSIGDHVFNEIENVRLLGGKTLWICPYRQINYGGCDLRLYTCDELTDFLRNQALNF